MNHLTKKNDFENVKALKQSGQNYEEIAKEYGDRGYVNKSGTKVARKDISTFMIENGFRIHKVHNRRKGKETVEIKVDSTLDQVTEIVNSNLSKEMKSLFLKKVLA